MTEYDTLKRVIVGVESYENSKIVDITMKHFFKDNLKNDYYRDESFTSYAVSDQQITERKEDLDNLANVLTSHGIIVTRPNKCNRIRGVKTPYFNSVFYSNSNVRDLTLTFGNKVITSQTTVRSRYFENILLNDILHDEMINHDKILLSPPIASLADDKIDFCDWIEYGCADKKFDFNFEILFDAANCIKVTPSDIIMNIGNRNHYNGYTWLKNVLPNVNIHPVYMCDNHIDGTLLPIAPGIFLVNTSFLKKDIKDYLPKKFHNWNFIEVNERKLDMKIYDDALLTGPQLATYEGININVLSISPDKIIIQDNAYRVIDALTKYNFNIIPIKFRHGVIFGGGIHCSTLDLERDA